MELTSKKDEVRTPICSDLDIIKARQTGRELAARLGFPSSDLALIATAISELARNIVRYAGSGEIIFNPVERGGKPGIIVIAHDDGPGIPNVELAMQDGYSTSGSLGLGLPGARRLMDEFDIVSRNQNGKGTTVTVKKWLR